MEEKKRRILHRVLSMAFAFAMLLTIAGLGTKLDAHAYEYERTVYVKLVDSSTGQVLMGEDVTPIVDRWVSSGYNYVPETWPQNEDGTFTQNEDGTFTYVIGDNESDWMQFSFGGSASGYATYRITSYRQATYISDIQDGQVFTVNLTPQTEEEALNLVRNSIKEQISTYKNPSDYRNDEQETLSSIIQQYSANVDDATTVSEMYAALADARSEMDMLKTAQSYTNDENYDKITFVSKNGSKVGLVGENGVYQIQLRSFEKGGKFQVEGFSGTQVTWNAKTKMWSSQIWNQFDVHYILAEGENRGGFMMQSLPSDVSYNKDITLPDCSVTFGNTTVTFSLVVIPCDITIGEIKLDDVELTRIDADGKEFDPVSYTVPVTATDEEFEPSGVRIESLTPAIAEEKDGAIIPHKTGTAKFKAISKDDPDQSKKFSIRFSYSEYEQQLIMQDYLDATDVIKAINDIGDVTLDSEEAIASARTAYTALNQSAKEKVTNYKTLTTAEKKLEALQAANNVDEMIEEIGEVSLESKAGIKAAREAYDELSSEAKDFVTKEEILQKAEKKLKQLQAADEVDSQIKAINEVTLDREEAIKAVRAAYEALAPEVKAYVKNEAALQDAEKKLNQLKIEKKDADAAKEVTTKIATIGDVTLAKESDVQAVRSAYNKLSANAKQLVGNYSILTTAEQKITALKAEEAKKAAEAKKVVLPKLTLKVKAAKRKATLTWKKASKADGYVIYRSTKKNGKYKKIKVVKGAKNVKYTDKKVKSKKTYYYKVCAYKGKVNGPLSAAKKGKVK